MDSFPNVDFYKTDSHLPPIEVFALDTFYAMRCGKSGALTPSPMDLHRVNFYSVMIVTHGSTRHWVDDAQYTLHKGDVLVVSPSQVQKFILPEQGAKGYIVIFTESVWEYIKSSAGVDFFRVPYWNQVISPTYTCSDATLMLCDSLLNNLWQEQQPASVDAQLQLLLFASIIRVLTRDWPKVNELNQDKSFLLFNRFTMRLAKEYQHSRDAQYYAEQLCVSYKMLNQVCKRVTQLTAKRIIDDFIILEAKRRLQLEKTAVKLLAYELGFDESTNFVKFFKRYTGKTPKQYMTTW